MQCNIILLKIVITLSNILFVKAEKCTVRTVLLDEFGTMPQIKTCYLEYSCTKTFWNKHTRRTEFVATRPTSVRCCDQYHQTPIHGKSFCIPNCHYRCVNAECTEPNTCTCYNGYVKKSFDQAQCIPTCDPPCIRGQCIAPNTCQCNSGYEMSVNRQNTCVCKTGFNITKRGGCIPVCVPECVNGKCIAPNECRCSSGYQPTGVPNTCKSVCKENCTHGYCTDGNCVCEDEWFGPDCNSTTITQSYNLDTQQSFPIEIGLSLTVLVLASIMFLLYKKQMFHCQRKAHDSDLDNFMVNNSIYGWVPK